MRLKVLSYNDVEQARIWRNENMSMNRTSYLLTPEMQGEFYQEQVNNRLANARYWGIWLEPQNNDYSNSRKETIACCSCETFISMGEITSISNENRNGEIGLIMHPDYVHIAEKTIELILEQGFDYLNLENIFGEVYVCSPYLDIWANIATKYNAAWCYLPNRKYWNGKYFGSQYFNISREDWKKCKSI
jgi:RimJ/RimL family protein N-acetyltransferase